MRYELSFFEHPQYGEMLRIRMDRALVASYLNEEQLEQAIETTCNIERLSAVAHVIEIQKTEFACWDDLIPRIMNSVQVFAEADELIEVANL